MISVERGINIDGEKLNHLPFALLLKKKTRGTAREVEDLKQFNY